MGEGWGGAINKEIARVITSIYDGKAAEIDPGLLASVGSLLESNVIKGFGKGYPEVDFNTPDAAMLMRITRDTWQFSAAKNYQQMRDMTLALKDENGKLRNFTDFKEAAKGINEKYNEAWLRTEYDTAIGSATMAARWNEFEKNSDIMPYLQYETAGDSRVRADHAALNGIIRKITDDFWKTHFPPNGWKCRCGANQIPSSTAKETETIPEVAINPLFKTNLAQSGLIYPKGHPYYEGVPRNIMAKAIAYLPADAGFKVVDKNCQIHILHGVDEAKKNIKVARFLANDHDVKLMPVINDIAHKDRQRIFGKGVLEGKSPDALIDNKTLFEIKVLDAEKTTKNNLGANIKHANTQSHNVFIVLNDTMPEKEIFSVVNGKLNCMSTLQQVWVKNGDKLLKYTK